MQFVLKYSDDVPAYRQTLYEPRILYKRLNVPAPIENMKLLT